MNAIIPNNSQDQSFLIPSTTLSTGFLNDDQNGFGVSPVSTPHPFIHDPCLDCGEPRTNFAWCKPCETNWFASQFQTWTSGFQELDEIIRSTQSNATQNGDYLEWIPFENFDLLQFEKRGAFSDIFSAIWLEGPKWEWDETSEEWVRNGPLNVALKRINGSRGSTSGFSDWLSHYYQCIQSGSLADTFGITKDPETGDYMLVMRWYENGDLHSYLDQISGDLTWRDKVDMLWGIVPGIEKIHQAGLVHGNIHGGNLLVEDETISTDARIADPGTWMQNEKSQLYGVLPYVAPECLRGEPRTQASDIYSFGMLMWMLSSGQRPFADRAHDEALATDIVKGLRPEIVEETPRLYEQLMRACWSDDPNERPSSRELNEQIGNWMTEICDNTSPNDISEQFEQAEEKRWQIVRSEKFVRPKIADGAVYNSRILKLPTLT